jgi:hypothetical protein
MTDVVEAAAGFKASVVRSGKWAAAIAAIGGFVADVLTPLAPFAAYLFFVGAVASLVLAVAILINRSLRVRAMPALVFALAATVTGGALHEVQRLRAAEDGVLADMAPAIARLQSSLGIVEAKVEQIDATVTRTEKQVIDLKAAVADQANVIQQRTQEIQLQQQAALQTQQKVEARTEQIALTVDAIARGFAALGANRSVIENPTRPDQHYHNARIYELTGDVLGARRSYLAFSGYGIDAIDPYLRFATLLRVQDGRTGAREVLGDVLSRKPVPAVKLAHALQFDGADRTRRIEQFLAETPDFSPAWFLLAEEFSEDRLGTQGLADKRREYDALTEFVKREQAGVLPRHFVDHTVIGEWTDKARRRLAALGNMSDPARYRITLKGTRSNQGWMITVMLPEPATALFWRVAGEPAFRETGTLDFRDQATGKPMPNPTFSLAGDLKPTDFEIRYMDAGGRMVGPQTISFNPSQVIADETRKILDQFWTSWVAFGESGPQAGLLYFTHLVSYRCAVKEARYGFNDGALDKAFPLPACDERNPYAIPENSLPYQRIGKDVQSVSVQVIYRDGSQSEVRRFNRR